MRSLPAGTTRSTMHLAALPGFGDKRRSLIAASAIALAFALCTTALAAPLPTDVDSSTFPQRSGPVAQRSNSDAPPAVAPRAHPDPTAAASAAAPTGSSGDGLATLAIVLISLGGILTLAGAAYIATRVVHGGHGHATG